MEGLVVPTPEQLPLALCDEAEMAARLALVMAHAAEFARIADFFADNLQAATEASHDAVLAMASTVAPEYPGPARRAYRDPVPLTACVTANAHEPGIAHCADLAIAGDPQRHYVAVAARRAAKKADVAEAREAQFEANELRRRQATLRATGQRLRIQESRAERSAAVAAATATKGHASAERQRAVHAQHAAVQAKHAQIAGDRTLAQLRAAAQADAVRRTDRMAAAAVAAQTAAAERREKEAAARVHRVAVDSRLHAAAVRGQASRLEAQRARMSRDFSAIVVAGEKDQRRVVGRRAAADQAAADRRQRRPVAVSIALPGDLAAEHRSPKRLAPAMDAGSYARLCGVRHAPVAASTGSMASVVEARHVPPSAWDLLHQLDPHAAELTYAAAANATVRSPPSIQWR